MLFILPKFHLKQQTMKVNIFIILMILSINAVAQNKSQKSNVDELKLLLENFQSSIVKKDSAFLYKIFFDRSTPIIGIMSDSTEMSIKKKNPNFQGLTVSNAQRFIKEICGSSKLQKEEIIKPTIRVTDKLATIDFLYVYSINEQIHQWGQEKWSLVFAENQWLIVNINFTIKYPSVEPIPKKLYK